MPRRKVDLVYIDTIMYPGDDERWWDVFRVVEEMAEPPFQIPFDMDAVFDGNPDDLIDAEMWKKPK